MRQIAIGQIGELSHLVGIVKLVVAAAFGIYVPFAGSATSPPELIIPHDASAAGSVIYFDLSTKEQQAFYWKDTTIHSGGFLLIRSDKSYVKLARSLPGKLSNAGAEKPLRGGCPKLSLLKLNSRFQENGAWRWTYSFSLPEGRRAMLTAWNFAKDKSKIFIPREFVNLPLAGGTASFSVASDAPDFGLWKFSWIEGDLQYESYIEDSYSLDGTPKRQVSDAMQVALEMARVCIVE